MGHENSFERQNFVDALEAVANRRQDALALQAPGRKPLTYNDLGQQVRYVRERLCGWGIAPGQIIAGAVSSRPELAVACVTLPVSSTFAPIDHSLTVENYAQLLGRMRPAAVLAMKGQEHPIRAAARQLAIPEMDLAAEAGAPAGSFTLEMRQPRTSPEAESAVPSSYAYVITSSGTTGRPKLIPSTHRQTLLFAEAIVERLRYSESDVSCLVTPIHHGNGLRNSLLNPLLGGLSVVCLPNSDIDAFFAAIETFQLTFLNAGFTLLRAILRRSNEFREVLQHSRIRLVRAGAGRIEPEEVEALEQAFGAPVVVCYSSGEAPGIAHDPLPPQTRRRGSAGLPLGCEVGIMEESGLISVGKGIGPGEIVVRGPRIFPGYLDEPELTGASFVGDWFRTGDLGCIDEDGYVFITGRIKEVISRGGEKISPAEIDAVLQSLAGVKEAAAFAIPHPSLGEEVVAALVAQGQASLDEARVLEQVRARMGAVKAPKKIYFVEALPRTSSGKVQRLELPRMLALELSVKKDSADRAAFGAAAASGAARPAAAGVGSAVGFAAAMSNAGTDAASGAIAAVIGARPVRGAAAAVAPVGACSPLEGAVAGLWAALLRVKSVGRTDNFFQLGGDETRGAQLLSQVKMLFGVELPAQSLSGDAATVAGMARMIESIRKGLARS